MGDDRAAAFFALAASCRDSAHFDRDSISWLSASAPPVGSVLPETPQYLWARRGEGMGDVQVYPIWVYVLLFVAIGAGVAIALVGLFTNAFVQPRHDWTKTRKKRPTE